MHAKTTSGIEVEIKVIIIRTGKFVIVALITPQVLCVTSIMGITGNSYHDTKLYI